MNTTIDFALHLAIEGIRQSGDVLDIGQIPGGGLQQQACCRTVAYSLWFLDGIEQSGDQWFTRLCENRLKLMTCFCEL